MGRHPAGEVPPFSRKPPGGEEFADSFAGFEYAVPGLQGTGAHYHIRMRDAEPATAMLAGRMPGRSLALRLYRARSSTEAALEVRKAASGLGASPAILDPATAGGCGDASDHPAPGGKVRPSPPVRVVRFAVDAGRLAKADEALAGIPGLERVLSTALGGPAVGEVWVDVHLIER